MQWTGSLMDGRMITDSKSDSNKMKTTFAQGNREVFRCFELVAAQLHKGDKAHVTCPANLVYGQAFTWSPLGGEPIPLGSDMQFDIEIQDCNVIPTKRAPDTQPRTTMMQPDQCFYLHLDSSEHTSLDLVLSTEQKRHADNWPAKYAMVEHKVVDDLSQQWYYDEATGSIRNGADPTFFLDNDFGWAMVAEAKADRDSKKTSK